LTRKAKPTTSDATKSGAAKSGAVKSDKAKSGAIKSGAIKSDSMMSERLAKFTIGQVVRHRRYPFRGVIFDIDPTFANTEEWWLSIPEEVRPRKDQPFYHLLAENAETEYVAYVSEQNLVPDTSGDPVRHPQIDDVFIRGEDGSYRMRPERQH
jgi:heat shock protein HspQ